MEGIRLRDIVPEEEVQAAVVAVMNALLDQPITITLGAKGIEGKLEHRREYTCPECGEAFASPSGLAGHRFHKHGVRLKGGKIVEELGEEDSTTT